MIAMAAAQSNQQATNLNFQLQVCQQELQQLNLRLRQAYNNYYYQVPF